MQADRPRPNDLDRMFRFGMIVGIAVGAGITSAVSVLIVLVAS